MNLLKKITSLTLITVTLLMSYTVPVFSEALDDKYTQIVPGHAPGGGEFIHGSGYGKILMRVMMFGAIPNQGVHYMPEGTDLLFAMLYAGGYTEATKLDSITIRRRNVKEIIKIDMEEVIENGEKVPRLTDGDVVNVPFNWRHDMTTIGSVTGFITAMTGFALSIIALSK